MLFCIEAGCCIACVAGVKSGKGMGARHFPFFVCLFVCLFVFFLRFSLWLYARQPGTGSQKKK